MHNGTPGLDVEIAGNLAKKKGKKDKGIVMAFVCAECENSYHTKEKFPLVVAAALKRAWARVHATEKGCTAHEQQ